MCIITHTFSQNRIEISYDASGNRIVKKTFGGLPNFQAGYTNNSVWPGQAAYIWANTCTNGNISWSNGQVGGASSSIMVNPTVTTNYVANCIVNGCPNSPIKRSVTVFVNSCAQRPETNLTDNYYDNFSSGNVKVEVSRKISATNKISGGSITYDAGNSIELKPGFEAKGNVVFKAQIDGCGNK